MATGKTCKYLVMIGLVILWSCHDDYQKQADVQASFSVVPTSGSTITQFDFNARQSFANFDDENPVFIRFDWEGDGVWDVDYTMNPELKHRYLKPGTYHVIMEVRDLQNIHDTSSVLVDVTQGYSPPCVFISAQPDLGNIFIQFHFDASKTYDDEESLDLLMYRWDFDGDGLWDTPFSGDSHIDHYYSSTGDFYAKVEVKDPTNRSSVANQVITVNMLNDSIKPRFTYHGGNSTVTDIFEFDATPSYDLGGDDRIVSYSWDIRNDGLWEGLDVRSPQFRSMINTVGMIMVKLRVKDVRGLYKDTVEVVQVFPENEPPKAVLRVGSRVGNTRTNWFFSSFGTLDRETSLMDLTYQWDVNNDGNWEPEFYNQKEVYVNYTQTGKHIIRLKVSDPNDNIDIVEDTVTVYNGTHETSVLVDKRPYPWEYYGIVKIGNLWWMQENMRTEIKPGPSGQPPPLIRWCYNSDTSLSATYGGLYNYKAVKYPICPDGWRLPSKLEFEQMVEQEAGNSISALLLGGRSEMHLLMGGYIDLKRHSIDFGSSTNLWLADQSSNGSPYVWYLDVLRGINRAVVSTSTYGYSVRCVKAE
jgi:uncharacterized protein (TIGR02145 family)